MKTMNAREKITGTIMLLIVLIMNEPASEILLTEVAAARETSGKANTASAKEVWIKVFFIGQISD